MKKTESELWRRIGRIEIGPKYERKYANEDEKIATRFFSGNASRIAGIAREFWLSKRRSSKNKHRRKKQSVCVGIAPITRAIANASAKCKRSIGDVT
jgi:hypothetical protein